MLSQVKASLCVSLACVVATRGQTSNYMLVKCDLGAHVLESCELFNTSDALLEHNVSTQWACQKADVANWLDFQEGSGALLAQAQLDKILTEV